MKELERLVLARRQEYKPLEVKEQEDNALREERLLKEVQEHMYQASHHLQVAYILLVDELKTEQQVPDILRQLALRIEYMRHEIPFIKMLTEDKN